MQKSVLVGILGSVLVLVLIFVGVLITTINSPTEVAAPVVQQPEPQVIIVEPAEAIVEEPQVASSNIEDIEVSIVTNSEEVNYRLLTVDLPFSVSTPLSKSKAKEISLYLIPDGKHIKTLERRTKGIDGLDVRIDVNNTEMSLFFEIETAEIQFIEEVD